MDRRWTAPRCAAAIDPSMPTSMRQFFGGFAGSDAVAGFAGSDEV